MRTDKVVSVGSTFETGQQVALSGWYEGIKGTLTDIEVWDNKIYCTVLDDEGEESHVESNLLRHINEESK